MTLQMAHVMRNDDKRRVFELSCFRAYNILRKHSARFLNLYMLVRTKLAPPLLRCSMARRVLTCHLLCPCQHVQMLPAGMPELECLDDIGYLLDKLNLEVRRPPMR